MRVSRNGSVKWVGAAGIAYAGSCLAQGLNGAPDPGFPDSTGIIQGMPTWGTLGSGLFALVLWLGWRVLSKPSAPQAYLYRLDDPHRQGFVLKNNVCRIGRSPDNDIQLNHKSISRYHAELVRGRNGAYTILDFSSKNGVRVGLRSVRSCVLREGDIIEIAGVRFRFTRQAMDSSVQYATETVQDASARWDAHRRGPRFECDLKVRLYNADAGWINAKVKDASSDGLYIRTRSKALPERARADVVFPVFDERHQRLLRLCANVVRVEKNGIALRITDNDGHSRKMLRSLIEKSTGPNINGRQLKAA